MPFPQDGGASDAAAGLTRRRSPAASSELRAKLALCWPRHSPPFKPKTLAHYIRYLHLMHDVIRASVPLMELALARWGGQTAHSSPLDDYYRGHIAEESGHVELVLQDLCELGISNTEALARIPNLTVVAMTGSQYYWLEHVSPLPLLGYIAFLEGAPPTSVTLDAVKALLPEGSKAYRALAVHAEADPHHSREMDQLLDRLALTPHQARLIGVSAMQTSQMFLGAAHSIIGEP